MASMVEQNTHCHVDCPVVSRSLPVCLRHHCRRQWDVQMLLSNRDFGLHSHHSACDWHAAVDLSPLCSPASYSVCMYQVLDQASMGSGWGERFGVYQCKANGGYPKGQIHWKMGGHPLVNTSRRDETHLDNSTGLYSLTSILTMDRSQGEKLQCMVENTDQASKLNSTCKEKPVYIRDSLLESPDKVAVAAGVSVSVVVMLVAGVLLVIFLLTRCHRRETSTKQRDTEERSVTQQLNMYEH
ncbi:ICOS ligand-like isoform X8 [Oncorhynchus keta]|uniref:ICOS ligand-like isoform X8 n=1 Tax=Oncorhynchus keta TaxID=8018 RepID=UPI00227D6299|nr:ICOS ligand-like isoform X8 [Oncorhynchus keta]